MLERVESHGAITAQAEAKAFREAAEASEIMFAITYNASALAAPPDFLISMLPLRGLLAISMASISGMLHLSSISGMLYLSSISGMLYLSSIS
jgi:hypothetical protein